MGSQWRESAFWCLASKTPLRNKTGRRVSGSIHLEVRRPNAREKSTLVDCLGVIALSSNHSGVSSCLQLMFLRRLPVINKSSIDVGHATAGATEHTNSFARSPCICLPLAGRPGQATNLFHQTRVSVPATCSNNENHARCYQRRFILAFLR